MQTYTMLPQYILVYLHIRIYCATKGYDIALELLMIEIDSLLIMHYNLPHYEKNTHHWQIVVP